MRISNYGYKSDGYEYTVSKGTSALHIALYEKYSTSQWTILFLSYCLLFIWKIWKPARKIHLILMNYESGHYYYSKNTPSPANSHCELCLLPRFFGHCSWYLPAYSFLTWFAILKPKYSWVRVAKLLTFHIRGCCFCFHKNLCSGN